MTKYTVLPQDDENLDITLTEAPDLVTIDINPASFTSTVTTGVDSINGFTGVVVLDSDDISQGLINLYYDEAVVDAHLADGTITDIKTSLLQFTGGTGTQGEVSWNNDEETLDLVLNGAVLQLGQEVHIHVRNTTGSTILNGTPVMATGSIGASGRITAAPMDGTNPDNSKYFLGIATTDILAGADGKVTEYGKVRGVNTTQFTDGDLLWISDTTPGALVNVEPTSPNISMHVGLVVHSAVSGTLFVRTNDVNEHKFAHRVHTHLMTDVTDSTWISSLSEDTTPTLSGTLIANTNSINMGVNTITDIAVGNWNTAHGWGDHSVVGYLTTETDPIFTASPSSSITNQNIIDWGTAYGWGDHGVAGYATTAYADAGDANRQPIDGGLSSISALVTGADQMLYTTALDAYATTGLTPFSRTLLDNTTLQQWRDDLNILTLTSIVPIANGSVVNETDETVTSDGVTVTFSLEALGGGDVQVFFSGVDFTIDTTPAATVVLTPGTDTAPVVNFVYIPEDTKVLTVGAQFPTAQAYVPIAEIIVPSATWVQANGVYKFHKWTDHLADPTGQGHLAHINSWIRSRPAGWENGVALTPVVVPAPTPDEVYISTTQGEILQLHEHNFPIFNTQTGSSIHVYNHPTTPYTPVTNLVSNAIDTSNNPIANNNFTTLVIWGVVSEQDTNCRLMMNLPEAFHSTEADAIADTEGYTNYVIPPEFSGSGFLIARLTLKYTTVSGGTWEVIQNRDLRGLFPSIAASGAGGGASQLTNLTDVTITTPSTNEYLLYNGSAWVNTTPGITTLSDVTITTPVLDEVLKYNGSTWVNAAAPAGGASALDDLTDVDVTTIPVQDGDILRYNGTASEWQNTNLGISLSPTISMEADYFNNVPITFTVTNHGTYDDVNYSFSILDSLDNVVYSNASVDLSAAPATYFFPAISTVGTYKLVSLAQDFGDISSEPTETTFTVSQFQFGTYRYIRVGDFTGQNDSSSRVMVAEFSLYTGASQTGTKYPDQTMTADNVPSPYVASTSQLFAGYEPFKAFDNNVNSGWWNLGTVNPFTDWLQIDLGSEIALQSFTVRSWQTGYRWTGYTVWASNTGAFAGEETEIITVSDLPFDSIIISNIG